MTQAEKEQYRGICEMYSSFSKSEIVKTATETARDLFRVISGKMGRESARGFMVILYAAISAADGAINATEYQFLSDTFLTPNRLTCDFSDFRTILNDAACRRMNVRECFYTELERGYYDAFFYKWKMMILAICIAAYDERINEDELYWLTNYIPYQL